MGGSCLQQRAEGYPAYVFHEPLHSLTQSYSHAHTTAAHSQPHRGIPTSHGGTPSTPGGQPAGPGGAPYQPTTSTATGKFTKNFQTSKKLMFDVKTSLTGLLRVNPCSTEIFRKHWRNVSWKYCKIDKIFQNLSQILLQSCYIRTEDDICNIFQILAKLANA